MPVPANVKPFQPRREADTPAPLSPTPPLASNSWLEGGLVVLDFSGNIIEANEPLLNWLEAASVDVKGRSLSEILVRFSSQWKGVLNEILGQTSPFFRKTLSFEAEGGFQAQAFCIELVRTPANFVLRLNSSLPNLSELAEGIWDEHLGNESARREMFMRLLRAEAQLETLMHRWPCVIFSQRPDFSMVFVSPNIAEFTGISVEQWQTDSKRFWELVHELDAPELQQQLKHAVQTGKDVTCTYRIRHSQTGKVSYVLEHRQPTISQNGLLLGYEVVWLDVTRQTIAEKRLSTAAWKETLAILTLGMAHDFRNIMAGIHSLSESYYAQVTETHPFQEGLGLIKKSSMQASQLVKRMIDLHLGQTGERSYHDLNEIARDLLELVSKILPKRIHIKTELAEGQLPVYADIVELRQVVINLLLNSADAMPQGGDLTLRTSRHTVIPTLSHSKGKILRAPCVCLSIQDTGCGIKQRHLESIFDPFFTTKSKGSGLGLYNAQISVEKHQGAISVESVENVGTSFNIWLPETDFSEPAPESIDAQLANVRRHSLLLVGHSGEMMERTAEFLRSKNYHITVASPPETMDELLQSNDYRFAGVFLLAEPNDSSVSVNITELSRRREKLKIVLKLAGLSQDEVKRQLLDGVDLLLGSEISESDMLSSLESLLKAS